MSQKGKSSIFAQTRLAPKAATSKCTLSNEEVNLSIIEHCGSAETRSSSNATNSESNDPDIRSSKTGCTSNTQTRIPKDSTSISDKHKEAATSKNKYSVSAQSRLVPKAIFSDRESVVKSSYKWKYSLDEIKADSNVTNINEEAVICTSRMKYCIHAQTRLYPKASPSVNIKYSIVARLKSKAAGDKLKCSDSDVESESRPLPLAEKYQISSAVPSVDMKDKSLCICIRPKEVILCKHCGATVTGRIRRECPAHPSVTYLLDVVACKSCKMADIQYLSESL